MNGQIAENVVIKAFVMNGVIKMGITNKEETLDWLYRLRSEIYVYMPKEWLIPMNNALDVAIDTVKREKMLEDWTKKCRKFEADYENRLKADMVAMLTDMLIDVEEIASREQWCDYANDNCISRYDVEDLFQQKINSLKEA